MTDMTAAAQPADDPMPARPRAVLNVDAAVALVAAAHDPAVAPAELHSPALFELDLPDGWHRALHPMAATPADYARSWAQLDWLVRAAVETGVLAVPDGTEIELEEVEPGLARLLVHPNGAAAVTLASSTFVPVDVADPATSAAGAAVHLLQDVTWRVSALLGGLYDAALPLLADYSNDPNLLAAIADTDDLDVRTAALRNPHTPDTARVMAALRGA